MKGIIKTKQIGDRAWLYIGSQSIPCIIACVHTTKNNTIAYDVFVTVIKYDQDENRQSEDYQTRFDNIDAIVLEKPPFWDMKDDLL